MLENRKRRRPACCLLHHFPLRATLDHGGECERKPYWTVATEAIAGGDVPRSVERLAARSTHDEIARRAYQLFEERGREPGHEWEDWFRAEREL